MRKKNTGFDHIGSVVKDILGEFAQKYEPGILRISEAWEGIVGESLAQNAIPSAMKGKILIVNVASSIWIQELHFLKNDLIMKINRKLGAETVTEMKFKIGRV
ncbi:MAG: DUF721 domain-containing protein [Proteobacteria bacterium]|nr:DUF721 domain-containing protein [Pseudomonadota bacterium]MBU4470242.1 DUF721 domain-containing protein [Pseudomonadota bacterium]MCG2752657.1 DUF721 domain-containing protein [Desulfobacteraceae bacterium]